MSNQQSRYCIICGIIQAIDRNLQTIDFLIEFCLCKGGEGPLNPIKHYVSSIIFFQAHKRIPSCTTFS